MEASQQQEFNSLHSQREFCEAYIASQRGEGWTILETRYDDGGYSGGSLQRPALKALIDSVEAGAIDVVVVYKIDRLSRSLGDFCNLVARFESKMVTFVSVTQSFNTTTPMGRLTLNTLLSFAQFERELTSERLSDFFGRARERGLWLNGRPYGYLVVDRRLVVERKEAKVIQWVFLNYPKIGSSRLIAEQLTKRGIHNKTGKPFKAANICHMIKHRVYLGEIVHRRKGVPGLAHEPIVTERQWIKAQKVIDEWRERRRPLRRCPVDAMLKGLLHDSGGHRMHHTFMHSKGRLYRYYISGHEKYRYGAGSSAATRFRAAELEIAVVDAVDRLAGLSRNDRSLSETVGCIRRLIYRIIIIDGKDMTITFRTGATICVPHKGQIGVE